MKSFLNGLKKVFGFTVRHRLTKGWKTATLIVMLLCFALPLGIMSFLEFTQKSDTPSAVISNVYTADLTDRNAFDFSVFNMIAKSSGNETFASISYHSFDTDEDALAAAETDTGNALVVVVTSDEDGFHTSVILPEASALSMDDADDYSDFLSQMFSVFAVAKSGASISDLTALGGISYKYSYYESQNGTDTLVSGDDANSEQNADATVKNVLGYMLPYVNIMLLYFLILFYGQGTANCVVLEKSSKLMDTMLVSVKPEAMVIGKVLAQAFTCVIQIALWVIGLWGGFAAGIWAVKTINPDTTMPLIQMFGHMGLLSSIFTPVNILFFLLYLAAGLLLYLAIASIGGAIASKQEDLSMTNGIFVIVLLLSFFATLGTGSFSGNFDSMGSVGILDWIPFTSILVSPSHLLLGSISIAKACGSLAVVVITALLGMALAGRIYKAMSMYKGNIPNAKQLFAMIFSK